ncbi:MAG TPA: hypothetical protein VGK32_19245 [Vicinamibacterales bacterium]
MSSPIIVEPCQMLDGWTIIAHRDSFSPGTSDKDVVERCGEEGWALVTCDEMRYTPETMVMMAELSVPLFRVVTKRETHFVEVLATLVKARTNIISTLRKNCTAFVAHIHTGGNVKVMTRYEEPAESLTDAQLKTKRKFGRL